MKNVIKSLAAVAILFGAIACGETAPATDAAAEGAAVVDTAAAAAAAVVDTAAAAVAPVAVDTTKKK